MAGLKSTTYASRFTTQPKGGVYVACDCNANRVPSYLFSLACSSISLPIYQQANKQKVIDALATQDATTRTYMAIRYKELFSKELSDVMKKEFSGE
jgi:hypothetical protein